MCHGRAINDKPSPGRQSATHGASWGSVLVPHNLWLPERQVLVRQATPSPLRHGRSKTSCSAEVPWCAVAAGLHPGPPCSATSALHKLSACLPLPSTHPQASACALPSTHTLGQQQRQQQAHTVGWAFGSTGSRLLGLQGGGWTLRLRLLRSVPRLLPRGQVAG